MKIDIRSQQKRLSKVIANAGPRYTPELNVEVSVDGIFDGFGRTFEFYDDFKNRIKTLVNAGHRSNTKKIEEIIGQRINRKLERDLELFLKTLNDIPSDGVEHELPLRQIGSEGKNITEQIHKAFDKMRQKKEELQNKEGEVKQERHTEPFSDERSYLNGLYREVSDLTYFANSRIAKAANKNFLVLRGNAGSGKTHFLCDLTKRRLNGGYPTYIFLGQEFNTKNPWDTILRKIDWKGSTQSFLSSLDKNASRKKKKAVIIVDAINEQKVYVTWSKLVDEIRPYKNVEVILSVRTGFEFISMPKGLRTKAIDVIHEGFSDREWDALKCFFEFYKLEPDIPFLFPEFTNPLFLKIFCETYQENDERIILTGHFGFTRVFERYVKKQGRRVLVELTWSNVDAQQLIWRNVIKNIADYMVNNKVESIPDNELINIASQTFSGHERKLIDLLERYSLLTKNLIYSSTAPYNVTGFEYAFPYQKFRHLLTDSSNIRQPRTLFWRNGRLRYIIDNPYKFPGDFLGLN